MIAFATTQADRIQVNLLIGANCMKFDSRVMKDVEGISKEDTQFHKKVKAKTKRVGEHYFISLPF